MLIWSSNYIMPVDLRDTIKERMEGDHSDKKRFYTTFHSGDKFQDLLIPYYSELVSDMMKDLGMYKRSQYDFSLWAQMYNSNTDSHPPHAHFTSNEIISFTHIITASKDRCFYFLDDEDNKIYHTHQDTGDIFAFPPWRLHGVDPVKEEGVDRMIVAGNIMLRSYHRPEDHVSAYSEKVGIGQCMWRYHD